MNFIDLLNGTAGLVSGIGTLLLGIAALWPHIKRLLKKQEPKKNLRDMGLLLGILLLIISVGIFGVRIISKDPQPIEVKITSPKDGDKVQGYSIVTGSIIGELPEGRYIWVVSYINSVQGLWWPQVGPVKPQYRLWNADVWLGSDNDSGKVFSIAAILVNENDNKIFVKYREEGNITRNYPAIKLPDSATIMDSIKVTRIKDMNS